MREYLSECEKTEIMPLGGVATAAVRAAGDGADFIAEIEQELGLRIEIIDGDREASLTWRGVTNLLPQLPTPSVIMDVGGGSTEVITCRDQPPKLFSLPFGSVTLTEKYLTADPPSEESLKRLAAVVEKAIAPLVCPAAALVGVGGTATTLTALAQGMEEYLPKQVHNAKLPYDHLLRLTRLLSRMPVAERELFPLLGPGRSDIIVAGAIVLQTALRLFQQQEVIISDNGILLGYILEKTKE